MSTVNNKTALNKLAMNPIKTNIKKYIILIIAVVMTTLLFSSLFTIAGSMLKEVQLSTMRQVGGSCHAGFKYLSEPEYDLVKDDPELKDITFRIIVGVVDDERVIKARTEVSYYEPLAAEFSFCYPEKGSMPEAENEIVLSDITLDALGVSHEIGTKFSMSVEINGESKLYDFVLSGYYRGDPISMAQMALVSRAFQEKYAPTKQNPITEYEYNDYTGWICADFNFSNSIDIEGKTQALIDRTGIREDVDTGINWAYVGSRLDPSVIFVCGILLITFFGAGYLIIYNIFYLNIISDMQEYGLLKTIGTTGKQLRKIVLRRATFVSVIGIPVGLLLGIGIGGVLLPVISNQFSTVSIDKGELHLNIWIILGAALFSYLTVIISAGKPCRKASSVSPIEALRFTETRGKDGKPKKKFVIVILSLSLALLVLNSVFAFVSGFSMDGYVSSMIIADFSVQDASLDNPSVSYVETQAIERDFLDALERQPGVEAVGNIYISEGEQYFDDATWSKIENGLLKDDMVREKIAYYYGEDSVEDHIARLNRDKSLDGNTYGMNEMAVSKLEVIASVDGSDRIDWEKFNSGNYVLITRWEYENNYCLNFLDPGDKVQIRSNDPQYMEMIEAELENGEVIAYPGFENAPSREYEILAVVDIPRAMELQRYREFQCDYILPESEFLDLNGSWKPMRTIIDVESGEEESMNEWLESYTTAVNPYLEYDSKDSVFEEYKSFSNMFQIVGTVVSIVLALIGLMNFANTIITSILVRSRELAMLEAVGMTGKQQKISLVKEGFVYFVWTLVFSAILSTLMNFTLLRFIMNEIPMFEWHFTLVPLAACLPVICLLILIIPVIAYNRLSKRSVVDRLRVE